MLVQLIVGLVVLGIVMYAINAFVPMEPNIKRVLNIAVLLIAILWVLQSMGLIGPLRQIGVQ